MGGKVNEIGLSCVNCGYSYRDDSDRVICPWLMNRPCGELHFCSAWVKRDPARA